MSLPRAFPGTWAGSCCHSPAQAPTALPVSAGVCEGDNSLGKSQVPSPLLEGWEYSSTPWCYGSGAALWEHPRWPVLTVMVAAFPAGCIPGRQR